jgi:hypothetical protein
LFQALKCWLLVLMGWNWILHINGFWENRNNFLLDTLHLSTDLANPVGRQCCCVFCLTCFLHATILNPGFYFSEATNCFIPRKCLRRASLDEGKLMIPCSKTCFSLA